MWTHAPSRSVPAPVPRLHRATPSSRRVVAASRRRGFGFQAFQARGARRVAATQTRRQHTKQHTTPRHAVLGGLLNNNNLQAIHLRRRFGTCLIEMMIAAFLADMSFCRPSSSASFSILLCTTVAVILFLTSRPPRSGTDKAPNPAADDQGHPTVGKQKTPPSKIWQRILAPMVTVNLV